MVKVYILTLGEYSGKCVSGVFSTLEAAKAFPYGKREWEENTPFGIGCCREFSADRDLLMTDEETDRHYDSDDYLDSMRTQYATISEFEVQGVIPAL